MLLKLSESIGARWWCPGCECMHIVPLKMFGHENGWDFDGLIVAPTFMPSVLVHSRKSLINEDLEWEDLTKDDNITVTPQCHCFIKFGQIIFLSDSTHKLSGMTVPMVDLDKLSTIKE